MRRVPIGDRQEVTRQTVGTGVRLVLLALLAGCGPPAAPGAPAPAPSPLLDPSSPEMNQEAPTTYKVLVETTKGDFVVEVWREWAPRGADRFYNLVRHGYYDDVHFFRTITGFVTQFGISGDPTVGRVWENARIEDDPVMNSNERGTITFATAGPNTRTVQLFINLENNSRLDAQGFAPFGRITGGMDAIERLYAGYGEGAPMGRGPDQERIRREGSSYLNQEFPLLDRILRARLL